MPRYPRANPLPATFGLNAAGIAWWKYRTGKTFAATLSPAGTPSRLKKFPDRKNRVRVTAGPGHPPAGDRHLARPRVLVAGHQLSIATTGHANQCPPRG